MKLILALLKTIDNTNPKDIITSILFYSDGSGRIYESGDKEIAQFDTYEEAEKLLNQKIWFQKKQKSS